MCGDFKFTIMDVVNMHGITAVRDHGRSVDIVCPFCGDRRGKMNVDVRKNTFHGFCCKEAEEGGNMLQLHAMLSGGTKADTARAYHELMNSLQSEEGDVLFKRAEAGTKGRRDDPQDLDCQADGSVLNHTYSRMLGFLDLRSSHRKDLMERGLSDAWIRRFRFRSTPSDTAGLCRKLLKAGCILKGVPGFYRNKNGAWDLHLTGRGLLCPVIDGRHGWIIGFQIRQDKPGKDSPKYVWLSSAGKKDGVSSRAPATCLPGTDSKGVVIATEGILKASVSYALSGGYTSIIGVPGISNYNSVRPYLEVLSFRIFKEAYDMEKSYPPDTEEHRKMAERVSDNAGKLRKVAREYGLETHACGWDVDSYGFWKGNYKGLDDMLLAEVRGERVMPGVDQ